MRNLCRAGFAALFKNKLFYVGLGGMAGFAVLLAAFRISEIQRGYTVDTIVDIYSSALMALYFIVPAFVAWFLGTEHSDGTLRNKIIVGHSRYLIFFAHFIVCFAASFMMFAAFFVFYLPLTTPFFGAATYFCKASFALYGQGFALITAMAGLCVTIATLCRNRAAGAIISLSLAIVLLFVGAYTFSKILQPETWESMDIVNGEVVEYTEPNPNYPRGVKRQILAFLNDFLPGGQMFTISDGETERFGLKIAYSGVILLASLSAGAVVFRRENLK